MHMSQFVLGIFVVTAGLGVGCGDQYEVPPGTVTPEDARRESAEAVATTAKLAEQTRAEYINQVKAEMAAIGKRFDTLQAETQALGRQAGEAWDDRLAQLADNRQALQDRLSEMTDSSGAAWRELAQGMNAARREMAEALQQAEAELEKQPAGQEG